MSAASAPASAQDPVVSLRVCAYCPNTCRPSYPAEAARQMESHTPSALSLMALAYLDGRLDAGSGVVQALQRREAIVASRGHCTYGLDMPAVLDAALKGMP